MQIQSQGSKTQVCSPIGSKGAADAGEASVGGFLEGMLPDWDDFSSPAPELAGDPAVRKFEPIILNDRQVYRVVVSKSSPPGQSHGLGHVTIGLLTHPN